METLASQVDLITKSEGRGGVTVQGSVLTRRATHEGQTQSRGMCAE